MGHFTLPSQAFSLTFAKNNSLLATSHITGHISIWNLKAPDDVRSVLTSRPHKQSCRCAEYFPEANSAKLLTGSKDKRCKVIDVGAGDAKITWASASHANAVNQVKITSWTTFASGDDAGNVRLWDCRTAEPVMVFPSIGDFVTCLDYNESRSNNIAATADNQLCVFDLRSKKVTWEVEGGKYDFLSCRVALDGTRVLCATGKKGELLSYAWEDFDVVAKYTIGPGILDSVALTANPSEMIVGDSEGNIFLVSLVPSLSKKLISKREDGIDLLVVSPENSLIGKISKLKQNSFGRIARHKIIHRYN